MNETIEKIIELQYKYTHESEFDNNVEMNIVLDSISFIALIVELEEEFNVELNELFLSYPEISIKQIELTIQKEIGIKNE